MDQKHVLSKSHAKCIHCDRDVQVLNQIGSIFWGNYSDSLSNHRIQSNDLILFSHKSHLHKHNINENVTRQFIT